MKRLLLFTFILGTVCSMGAQTEENLFDWQGENTIVTKEKHLNLLGEMYNNPTHVYREYDVSTNERDSYTLKIIGFDETMSELGTYDGLEIYHNGNRILKHFSCGHLYNVQFVTAKSSKDYFIKVPLSDGSFALFFGGWLYGSGGETTEMVVVVVSGGTAKVVFDDYAYAYNYTPGENFAIEYLDNISGLPITENDLKTSTKHKIWKEGNMLKYKSWK